MREKPTKSRSQRFADAIILLTMAAILAAGCLTFADYGFTLDEATERRSSVITYQYVLKTLLGHELRVVDTDLADHRDRYYGVALQLPLVAAEHLAHFDMAPRNIYLMRHLYTFLICWLGYVCFFFFCKRVFGSKWLALLGMLMLALYPRFWGEQFNNIKDMVFMSTVCASMLATAICLEREGSFRFEALAALVSAVSANTRMIGAVIPLLLFGYRLVRDLFIRHVAREAGYARLLRNIGRYAAQLLLFYVFFVLLTPALWADPVGGTAAMLSTFSDFSRWYGVELFMGGLYTKVPWYYIPVWLAISLPLWYLLLMPVSAAAVIRDVSALRKERPGRGWMTVLLTEERYFAFCFALSFLPWLAAAVNGSTLYNGWRHFYFILQALIVLMLYAVRLLRRLARRGVARRALACGICLLVAAQCGWIAAHHPFEKLYFNPLGMRVADGFSRDYWQEAYYAQLKYILRNAPSYPIRIGYADAAGCFLDEADYAGISFVEGGQPADYLIENYARWTSPGDAAHEGYTPWHTLFVDGHPFSTIFIRDGLQER